MAAGDGKLAREKSQFNGLAAKFRILEAQLKRGGSSACGREGTGAPLGSSILESANVIHDMLDRAGSHHSHSLGAAIRCAFGSGVIDAGMKAKLSRLSKAADALRHITVYSCELLVSQLADGFAGQAATKDLELPDEVLTKEFASDTSSEEAALGSVGTRGVDGLACGPGPVAPEVSAGGCAAEFILQGIALLMGTEEEDRCVQHSKQGMEAQAGDYEPMEFDDVLSPWARYGWIDYGFCGETAAATSSEEGEHELFEHEKSPSGGGENEEPIIEDDGGEAGYLEHEFYDLGREVLRGQYPGLPVRAHTRGLR
jgi:hypothetical protein